MNEITTTDPKNLTTTEDRAEDGALTLLGEVAAVEKLLDAVAATPDAPAAQVLACVDTLTVLRTAQSKFQSEAVQLEEVIELAERYCQFLVEACPNYRADEFLESVRDSIGIDQRADRTSLTDLRIVRKLLRVNASPAVLLTACNTIRRTIAACHDLGLSSGELKTVGEVCNTIKQFVRDSANYFPDDFSGDATIVVDTASTQMHDLVMEHIP